VRLVRLETTALEPWDVRPEDFAGLVSYNTVNLKTNDRGEVEVIDEVEADRKLTGRVRCIGCGRFVRMDAHWNQCADCDTRTPEDY